MTKAKDPHEEKLRQLIIIEKLATRLPWIVLGISLVAFVIIFIELLVTKN